MSTTAVFIESILFFGLVYLMVREGVTLWKECH